MCGVVGVFNKTIVDKGIFKSQLNSINHRGPDDDGIWFNHTSTLALGSKRLAIQDISLNGHMPMISNDGKYVLVFNGEIYNYLELKQKLIFVGYCFKSTSDTEVVLYSFMHWGLKFLEYLNGMFAVAIYNNENGELLIARDRSGEKPLYYWKHENGFEFGSELKALLINPSLKRILNPDAFYQYLQNGYCSREVSFIKGVNKLTAAHYLIYDTKNQILKIERYWELPKPNINLKSKDELLERLDVLLNDSVKKQLIADVPIGVLLSGGVDSSLITAYAAENCGHKIKTFHVSFDGNGGYNEKQYADIISKRFDTEHLELNGNEINYDIIDELINYFDEPIADSSILPTYLVSKLTKEHVTVALGGDGGDELFGGYPHYSKFLNTHKLFIPGRIREVIAKFAANLPVGMKGRNYLMTMKGDVYNRFLYNKLYDELVIKKVLSNQYFHENYDKGRSFKKIENTGDILYDLTKYDFENNFVDDILTKVDRCSMGTSLEIRAPFLDKNIIEFAFGEIPSALKVVDNNLKTIPKELLKRKLNLEFDVNRKQGFSIPLHNWMKTKWRFEIISDIESLPDNLINKSYVMYLVEGLDKGYTNSSKIFSLIILAKWMKKYKIVY
jgi:asparagine synthase (glutamine-hydrolysing)